jgi:glutamate---cysteine ligase / carboxylate-amine ligase
VRDLPAWAAWPAGSTADQLTIGIEEEFMLLDPRDWSLAFRSDEVIAGLAPDLRRRVTPETHAAVMEITTGVHRRVSDAVAELAELRGRVSRALAEQGLRAAVAGLHPSTVRSETVLSSHARYREIGETMRVLAYREPTLAMHVHVGVATPRAAVALLNRIRVHLPLLLALSANSPFWQGRATGFASTRTTLRDAYPRSGVPRAFRDYADWAETVDRLLRSGAITEPSFLWGDVRLQPRHGTVEIRIMDGQTTLEAVGAIVALVQSLARFELGRPDRPNQEPPATEVIEESRFLAARDGMHALLIDGASGHRVLAVAQLERVLALCRRHADRLGCARELAAVRALVQDGGAARQLADARVGDLRRVTAGLARAYAPVEIDRRSEPDRRAA